jgi:hypothetical protein
VHAELSTPSIARGFRFAVALAAGLSFASRSAAPQTPALIYLENCEPGGCLYHRSTFEDSRQNRSTVVQFMNASLPEFGFTPEFWDEVVTCVRRAYAPFFVEITDVDPGAAQHLEHVVAGLPGNIGHPKDTLGVSPFTCGFIPNSISFTFSAQFGDQPTPEALAEICWTIVHEVGHQHGLDHHAYVPDAMTYAPGCEPKLLPARNVPCGEFVPEPCLCGGSAENSYERIRAVHGPGGVLFQDGFEIVQKGENCAWSEQVPPPEPPAPDALLRPIGAARCATLEPTNPGLRFP